VFSAVFTRNAGRRRSSVEEAYALADALGVSITELLGETEETPQEEGVELRFEVTVKLLPSRETPTDKFIEQVRQKAAAKGYGSQKTRLTGKDPQISKATIRGGRDAPAPSRVASKTTRKATKR
jgi:hypothetical protein